MLTVPWCARFVLQEFRRNDLDRLHQREDEVERLHMQNASLRQTLTELQKAADVAEIKLDTERSIRQEVERQRDDLM